MSPLSYYSSSAGPRRCRCPAALPAFSGPRCSGRSWSPRRPCCAGSCSSRMGGRLLHVLGAVSRLVCPPRLTRTFVPCRPLTWLGSSSVSGCPGPHGRGVATLGARRTKAPQQKRSCKARNSALSPGNRRRTEGGQGFCLRLEAS